jgi:iron transport multicopper oxidase
MPNHNIHPSIVTGWSQIWKQTFNAREQWYAKPLVYTPSGKSQVLVTASNMNIVRVMDAVTGAVITSRTLQPPFLQADAACGDMANYIGVAGTPVIDSATDTVYMFSKGYKNGLAGPQGMPQGESIPRALF